MKNTKVELFSIGECETVTALEACPVKLSRYFKRLNFCRFALTRNTWREVAACVNAIMVVVRNVDLKSHNGIDQATHLGIYQAMGHISRVQLGVKIRNIIVMSGISVNSNLIFYGGCPRIGHSADGISINPRRPIQLVGTRGGTLN
ncbi:hypothetical protein CBL_07744 [Carabus blaptoides fortunei]